MTFGVVLSAFPSCLCAGETQRGWVKEIVESSFGKEVLKSSVPVLVDFWAVWCGPCRMFGPTVDQVAEDYKGRLKVVRVNIDKNRELAGTYQIRAIPTTLLFKKGKIIKGWVGLVSKADIERAVNTVLNKAKKSPLSGD